MTQQTCKLSGFYILSFLKTHLQYVVPYELWSQTEDAVFNQMLDLWDIVIPNKHIGQQIGHPTFVPHRQSQLVDFCTTTGKQSEKFNLLNEPKTD